MARAFPGQIAAIFIREVVGISETSPLLTDEALKELSVKPLETPARPKSPELESEKPKTIEVDTRPVDVKLADRLQIAFHGLDYSQWKIFTDPATIKNDPAVMYLFPEDH